MSILGSDKRQTKARALAMYNKDRLAEARVLYEEVCHAHEDDAEAWYFLGIIHMRLEAYEESSRCLARSIQLQPGILEAHNNLGIVYIHLKAPDNAMACFSRALEIRPDSLEAQMNLGKALQDSGDLDAALLRFREALNSNPLSAPVHDAVGTALLQIGRTQESIVHYQRALQLAPDFVNSCLNLANALTDLGRLSEAEALYRKCLVLDPGFVEAYLNLGNLTHMQGRYRETEQCLYKALELDPNFPEAYNSLGNLYQKQNLLDKAANHYRKALELAPDSVEAHNNLGTVLQHQGLKKESMAEYRRALELNPAYDKAHSNLLAAFNYSAAYSVEEIYRAHAAYGELQADACLLEAAGHANSRDEGRRLRVGYVSADFRAHSVAYFFEPIVAAHDRSRVEVYCYANVKRPDETTQRLQGLSDHWRDIYRMSDAAAAERIRADRIDVLVDLGGHMEGHRLKVFARKPAPVQVTYLGYPNTTGMQAIDYRLTDRWADPEGASDQWYTESLVRLERGFLCYRPPVEAPEVGPLPAQQSGVITFGCFNNSIKVTAEVVALWGGILQAVPGSRLLLKSNRLADAGLRARFREQFEAQGIGAERLELLGNIPGQAAHLALYGRVDIGLDPFPYHGTTTTCEALWMGVPVITLAGDRHACRVGVGLLHQVGLEDWIAHSVDEYRALAVRWAADVQGLEVLRGRLRAQMRASSLMDEAGFARQLESAYRSLWRQWCKQG